MYLVFFFISPKYINSQQFIVFIYVTLMFISYFDLAMSFNYYKFWILSDWSSLITISQSLFNLIVDSFPLFVVKSISTGTCTRSGSGIAYIFLKEANYKINFESRVLFIDIFILYKNLIAISNVLCSFLFKRLLKLLLGL